MTVRLPDDVHENLRREAFKTRRPMNELVSESLSARYVTAEQYGDICDVVERIGLRLPPKPDDPDDSGFMHTSNEARRATNRIIEILGLEVGTS